MTPSLHGPLPREMARVLAHLPECVRVSWQDHRLFGTQLPVHGWHRIHGELHLLVTLPDGSRSYFPATGTTLFDTQELNRPAVLVTGDGIRRLRQLMEMLQERGRRRRRSSDAKSK